MLEKENLFPKDISTIGHKVDALFYGTVIETGIAFLLVVSILLYFIIRYRERSCHQSFYTHGNRLPHLLLTGGLALSVFFFIDMRLANLSARVWDDFHKRIPTENIFPVRILAQQYVWNIQYPGKDGLYNTPDDIRTINQLHIPIHQPVVVELESKDVIHSFWLPNFRFKQDVVPGMTQKVWFEATELGKFEIACAELCGLGHYRMRGHLNVETKENLEKWFNEQRKENQKTSSEEEW